ncbi:DUF998 domain-containing protein, partial [Botrimarina colliarenosi]|uniref:DUF998 domain-containing protein n=1 Tax=Botrimarina colliarenosi TaxID=2528001 RepID=UPI001E58A15F
MLKPVSDRFRSSAMVALATVTLIACATVLATDVTGWLVVEKHNPITETISKLAIGKQSWIQDYGLNTFAAGLAACAVGYFLWDLGGWRRRTAAAFLLLGAVDVLVISEFDQYAGFDDLGGTIHMSCVYILYALFATIPILLGLELSQVDPWYRNASVAFACCWIVGGPLYLFATPGSIDVACSPKADPGVMRVSTAPEGPQGDSRCQRSEGSVTARKKWCVS